MRRLCCVRKEVHPKSWISFWGAWLMEEIKKLKWGVRQRERAWKWDEGKGEECGVQNMFVDGGNGFLVVICVGLGWGGVGFCLCRGI